MSAADEVRAAAARLREIADRLRDPDLPECETDGLAREAADLVAKAGQDLERAVAETDRERELSIPTTCASWSRATSPG